MKNIPISMQMTAVILATASFAILFTSPVSAQGDAKGEPNKKVVVKIYSDENGTKTVVDTTMEFPAGEIADSVNKEIEKVIELGRSGKHARMKIKGMPREFSYNFEMPCLPDCPMDMKDFEELEFDLQGRLGDLENFRWDDMNPGPPAGRIRPGGRGQTLNDVLGDIPMDRVKSYSIKDTKNGKKIVIELNDGPMVERRDHVIVIREPGRERRGMNHPPRKVRVVVNADDEQEQPEQAPGEISKPVAPPAPSARPEKK